MENHLQSQQVGAADIPRVEAEYRRILSADPKNVDALHGLGWLAFQAGRPDVALNLLQQALALRSNDATLHLHFALTNQRLARHAEAEGAFKRACELKPKDAELLNCRGIHLMGQGKRDEGVAMFERAVKANPNHAQSYRNLGLACMEQNKLAQAEAVFREWVNFEPDSPEALQLLGRAIGRLNRTDEAIDCLQRALQLDPAHAEANYFLAVALRMQRRLEEASEPLRRAVIAQPNQHTMLREQAKNFADLGDHTTALAIYDRVLLLQPNDIETRGTRAQSLLYLGRLAEGWREYEWRWKATSFPHNRRHTHTPQWTGYDIAGKSILIHTEQGFGDAFQFSRYVPLVAQRGARVLLQSNREALVVLRTLEGVSEFFEYDQLVPKTDLQCPLMSLPLAFGTTLQNIPNQVPYLRADPGRIEQWKPRLAAPPGVRKIGLFWHGRANNPRNAERAVPLSMLSALASVPNASFFSLQKGKPADDTIEGVELIRLGADLRDFADTAAVISQLDLMISVDTAVVHLAGALGKPVWTLVSSASDFRWMLEREDSPWYPTMRLFRQKKRGDWGEVVERVVAALNEAP